MPQRLRPDDLLVNDSPRRCSLALDRASAGVTDKDGVTRLCVQAFGETRRTYRRLRRPVLTRGTRAASVTSVTLRAHRGWLLTSISCCRCDMAGALIESVVRRCSDEYLQRGDGAI